MAGFKSSNSDSRPVNSGTMKLTTCSKVVESLMAQGFLAIEKARWFRIKTIVLIWSEWRDSFAFSSRREENRGVAAVKPTASDCPPDSRI